MELRDNIYQGRAITMDCHHYTTELAERKRGQHLQREERGAIQALKRQGLSYNFGAYDNPEVTALIEELSKEFNTAKRGEMAVKLQQMILDDNAYVFCSFLQMNMISKENVKNYTAHACDYYQVTAQLDIE